MPKVSRFFVKAALLCLVLGGAVAGLALSGAGGQIPLHPGDFGVYHFVEGAGQMYVGEATLDVQPGATVIVPAGAPRGMIAHSRLAFIAVRNA